MILGRLAVLACGMKDPRHPIQRSNASNLCDRLPLSGRGAQPELIFALKRDENRTSEVPFLELAELVEKN